MTLKQARQVTRFARQDDPNPVHIAAVESKRLAKIDRQRHTANSEVTTDILSRDDTDMFDTNP